MTSVAGDNGGRVIGYRADIDGLRAIAVVLVVGFHVGVPGVTGGFIGVDVFFVISGFLITSLLAREIASTGRISWRSFYARRARRLLPALAVVVLATLLASLFVMVPDPELRWLGQSVISVATFTSNVFFDLKTTDYFGAEADTLPLLHTWSLAVEEQFYIVWPVLLSAAAWSAHRLNIGLRRSAVVAVAVVATASLIGSVVLTGISQSRAFYWMPSRLWELAAGGMLALVSHRLADATRRSPASVMGVLGVAAILLSTVLLDASSPFPGTAAIPVVVGTVMVIAAGCSNAANPVSRLLGDRRIVHIGRLSYSWYLIHWPMLTLARIATLEHSLLRDTVIALLSLGLAELSYRYVEQPFRVHGARHKRSPWRALAGGAVAVVVLLASGTLVVRDAEGASRLDLSGSELAALRENRTARDACPNLPEGRSPAVDCSFSSGSDQRLALVGDSHALAILPAAQRAADELGWQLDVLWDTACPFVLDYSPDGNGRHLGAPCREENAIRARHLLAHADEYGGVILTGRWSSWLPDGDEDEMDAASKQWSAAYRGTVRTLAERGIPVLVQQDVPRFKHPVPQCVVRLGSDRCALTVDDARAARHHIAAAQERVLRDLAGVGVFDPFEVLCDVRCRPTEGSDVLYRDRDHLSEQGAAHLAKALVPVAIEFFSASDRAS